MKAFYPLREACLQISFYKLRINWLRRNVLLQEMVSLEDVTVKFTWDEWQNLNNAQKMLYRNVMLETYSSLLSLGKTQEQATSMQ